MTNNKKRSSSSQASSDNRVVVGNRQCGWQQYCVATSV